MDEFDLTEADLKSMKCIFSFQTYNHMFNKSGTNEKVTEQGKYCLILDTRPSKQFQEKQISSISVNLPTDNLETDYFNNVVFEKLFRKVKERTREKLQIFKRLFIIIIVSNEFTPKDNLKKPSLTDEHLLKSQLLYRWLIKSKCREVGILYEGLNIFEKKYPFLISYTGDDCELAEINDFPSEILEGKLFVGNELHVYF